MKTFKERLEILREQANNMILIEQFDGRDPHKVQSILNNWDLVDHEFIVDAVDRLLMIADAVDAQAEDEGLWCKAEHASEGYIQQSLRLLHRVVETGSGKSLFKIQQQSNDSGEKKQ